MTTRDQARRTLRRSAEGEGDPADAVGVESGARTSLPERLSTARDAKGVDLYRAERDTKIRARYLAALERGDYAELPGAVYTKGFLRNYALYLGLNPDEILEQWRRERGDKAVSQPVVVVPRPLAAPRQGIVLSPSLLVVALLVLVIGGVGTYLAMQVSRFVQPVTVTVTNPSDTSATVASSATGYTFQGTATAGVSVSVSWDGKLIDSVVADAGGHWTYTTQSLHKGSNQFEFTATDIQTQHHSDKVTRIVVVPLPTENPQATPQLLLTTPIEGATYQNGAVVVEGTTIAATHVSISQTYLGPPLAPGVTPGPSPTPAPTKTPGPTPKPTKTPAAGASAAPTPAASTPPPPVTTSVGSDGAFSATVQLTAGRWQLVVTASNDQGREISVTRTVTVAYKGLQVVIQIKNGPAWLKIWRDGVVDNAISAKVYKAGETLTISANQSVWIRTGAAATTFVTVNGLSYGALGPKANPGSWRIDATGPPKPSSDT